MAVSSCMKVHGTIGHQKGSVAVTSGSGCCVFSAPHLGIIDINWLFQPTASSDDMTLTSPSMDNSSAELLPSGDSPLNKRMTENLLASLSEHERAAILNVPAAQNPEDLRMFAR